MIPVLLGGKTEVDLNDRIAHALQRSKIPYLRPGEDLEIRHFMSIVRQMDGFLCGDTFAMHVALAFQIPTVILFTSTCHQEIELYDTGTALIGTAECAPCYLSQCRQPTQYCAQSISVTEVVNAVIERIQSRKTGENIRRRSNI